MTLSKAEAVGGYAELQAARVARADIAAAASECVAGVAFVRAARIVAHPTFLRTALGAPTKLALILL